MGARRRKDSCRPWLHSPRGPVAQLVEQGTFNPKVAGSNPARPIESALKLARPLATAERLFDLEPQRHAVDLVVRREAAGEPAGLPCQQAGLGEAARRRCAGTADSWISATRSGSSISSITASRRCAQVSDSS